MRKMVRADGTFEPYRPRVKKINRECVMSQRLTYLVEHLQAAVDELKMHAAEVNPQVPDVLDGIIGIRNWTTDIIEWCSDRARARER